MLVSTIAFVIAPGKNAEAIAYLKTIAKAAEARSGVEMRLHSSVLGVAGTVLLASNFETVADWDAARLKGQNDPDLQKMIADAGKAGLFLPGSVTRAVWEQL